jgi:hypothetical protein
MHEHARLFHPGRLLYSSTVPHTVRCIPDRRTPGAIVHKKSESNKHKEIKSYACDRRGLCQLPSAIYSHTSSSRPWPHSLTQSTVSIHPSTTQTAEQPRAWKATPQRTTQQRRSLFASFLSCSGLPHESCGQQRTQDRTLPN